MGVWFYLMVLICGTYLIFRTNYWNLLYPLKFLLLLMLYTIFGLGKLRDNIASPRPLKRKMLRWHDPELVTKKHNQWSGMVSCPFHIFWIIYILLFPKKISFMFSILPYEVKIGTGFSLLVWIYESHLLIGYWKSYH